MSVPTILGKPQADILADIGVALLQVKNERRLTLDDVGAVLGRSREMVAQYIAGDAEMGVIPFLRAKETWPELAEKLAGVRQAKIAGGAA